MVLPRGGLRQQEQPLHQVPCLSRPCSASPLLSLVGPAAEPPRLTGALSIPISPQFPVREHSPGRAAPSLACPRRKRRTRPPALRCRGAAARAPIGPAAGRAPAARPEDDAPPRPAPPFGSGNLSLVSSDGDTRLPPAEPTGAARARHGAGEEGHYGPRLGSNTVLRGRWASQAYRQRRRFERKGRNYPRATAVNGRRCEASAYTQRTGPLKAGRDQPRNAASTGPPSRRLARTTRGADRRVPKPPRARRGGRQGGDTTA